MNHLKKDSSPPPPNILLMPPMFGVCHQAVGNEKAGVIEFANIHHFSLLQF